MAKGKHLLGSIAYFAGEHKTALQYVLASIALWRDLENPFELATALNRLSGPLIEINEYAAATLALEECRISINHSVTGACRPSHSKPGP